MKVVVLLISIIFSIEVLAFQHMRPVKPDPSMTPGQLCSESDFDFDGHRYQENIPHCARNVDGWTKNGIYTDYGVNLSQKSHYTIDHLVPLSIGGNNSVYNLWPEPKSIKRLRQNLEYDVYQNLREGYVTQQEAIEIILDAKFNPPVN